MRPTPNERAEQYRITTGPKASDRSYGNNGAFEITLPTGNLFVIASDGLGWEHVSVSHYKRLPRWDEMCLIKDLFWDGEEIVMQLHPAKSTYVNNHPYCLHLWRPINSKIPIPDVMLVGIPGFEGKVK